MKRKKHMIQPPNFPEPFEDRRGMPPLTDDMRNWAPIIFPLLGVFITVGIYIATVAGTTALANENRKSVEINKQVITSVDKRLAINENNFSNIDNRLKSIERKVDILIGIK